MTFQDRFLTALADVSGKLRHYKRLLSSDGDKIVFCSDFIARIDGFFAGVKCRYTPSDMRDFNGFCAFADGVNDDEEYAALDAQLAAAVTGDKTFFEGICSCQAQKQVL